MSTEPASRPSRSGSTVGGSVLEQLREPIVQAPMAGGPSTPALAGAVCEAGGLGFLASGMKTVEALRAELDALRGLTREPFGVNLFLLSEAPVDEQALEAYVARLQPEGERYGVELGRPRHDDDGWEAKLELLAREGAAVVSFTFGCPSREAVDVLHRAGAEAWVTVTGPEEAGEAQAAGADVLVVQGVEAGGHRGSFSDRDGSGELGLLPMLRLVARASSKPLVAAGGIGDGRAVAGALAAGASAVQVGTAFLRTPEAGTSPVHRTALGELQGTALTRAFTGRRARGLVNRFLEEHSSHAPSAYPHLAFVTAPLRPAAVERDDPGSLPLWAGEAHALTVELPAGDLVRRWGAEAREALRESAARWG